jgi:NET1-associated nuclear protein 1 (U3 small nucleolar RNA-associated protein 17)
MASALKRKRGTVDVKDSPKKSKSFNDSQDSSAASKLLNQAGWDAAFNAATKTKELVHTNGINGDGAESQRQSKSPEAVDFEAFVEEGAGRLAEEENLKKSKAKQAKQTKQENKAKRSSAHAWKLSQPIGGRMVPVDPVFTEDERFVAVSKPQIAC